MFENMLRRIFGPRKVEVPEEWRRLRNEELGDLYSSPNSVRVRSYKKSCIISHDKLHVKVE